MRINDVRAYATAGTTYVGGSDAIAVGAATQTLVVSVSEDALAGDAQFQIEVNGTAISGVLTTQSLHSLGQVDSLTFNGTWNAGVNTVSVVYLNAVAGRDLYVNAITLDGVAAPGAPVALTANGTTSFVVPMAPVVLGSGPDTLTLNISEDAYLGDAQFTIAVDGVRQGGTLTTSASNGAGQSQAFAVAGSFGTGAHSVTVDFLNNLYGGSATTDRNLFVLGAQLNGVALAGSTLNEYSGGAQSFSFGAVTPAPAPAPTSATTVIGSGADALLLNISEDAYLGDAQFTVSVDGVQQGGTLTAAAANALGQSQAFQINGGFAAGPHQVSVNFLNDFYGGSALADRNLFVLGATINGAAVAGSALNEYGGGSQSFGFVMPAAVVPVTGGGTATAGGATAAAVRTLSLGVAEDAWNGDAQYQVTVDGVAVGGVRSATASHALGQSDIVTLTGNWGNGAHSIGVNFLNDAYGGSAGTDRNLYVTSVALDGNAASGAPAALYGGGVRSFLTPAITAQSLTLNVSEDAYKGDALFTVAVDGAQIGGALSATALHAIGASQGFTFANALTIGTHDLAVAFLNDAYGGSAGMDRNLFVDSVSAGGVAVAGGSAALYSAGTAHFAITVPHLM
jgi:hypothetical protein